MIQTKMKQRNRNSRGMTLSELLITLVVLGLALAPIVNFFSSSLNQSNENRVRTQARYLAEEELEKVISLDYFDTELDVYSNPLGRTQFLELDTFLVKVNIVLVDPKTLTIADPYPTQKEDDTFMKKVTISAARRDYVGGQVDVIYYKSP